jgi:hypothetical protein
MKDLQLTDILAKPVRPLINLSVYANGRWSFATLNAPTVVTSDQNFYLISYPFGLLTKAQSNPAKFSIKGEPGDYVSQDIQGTLALVKASVFALQFPGPQQITPPPPSSESLKDPNFLTKIQEGSVDKNSDKVMIGDRQYTIASTFEKTIKIIETPEGLAKVFYDDSEEAPTIKPKDQESPQTGNSGYDPDDRSNILRPVPY